MEYDELVLLAFDAFPTLNYVLDPYMIEVGMPQPTGWYIAVDCLQNATHKDSHLHFSNVGGRGDTNLMLARVGGATSALL
jgi:hypothetical protein